VTELRGIHFERVPDDGNTAPTRGITFDPDSEGGIEEFADQCGAHKGHYPSPIYLELHHLSPQAWQKSEAGKWLFVERDKNGLFLPQTVPLCRTGHGNVHYWLQLAMKTWWNNNQANPEPAETEAGVRAVFAQITKGRQHHHPEVAFSQLGMVRWLSVGGKLADLCRLHQWGGIY
jgi:hypothetical protein